MHRQRRGALAVAAVLLVGVVAAGLVVLSSAGGSVRPVSESTLKFSPRPVPTSTHQPGAIAPTPLPPAPGSQIKRRPFPDWLEALWQALVWLAIAAAVLFIGLFGYRIIRKVQLPKPEPDDVDWERAKVDRLAEAVDSGLARIDSGMPTDAVIACWVAFEEAAASAGVPRDPAETPREFTVRVLAVGGISAPQLIRLGQLYREARYSTHGSTERARAEARAALLRLREELSVTQSAHEDAAEGVAR